MQNIVFGIVAHVDAGKTTLSEAMLYKSGAVREFGRVDKGDAYLDNFLLERERGITIFSKQALLRWGEMNMNLIDTPGHIDFSGEAERAIQILDYGILVINGSDGVQGHTLTLWHLLEKYNIPVYIFVNKMDMPGADKNQLMAELKRKLSSNCMDFSIKGKEAFYEEMSLTDENLLEEYMSQGTISTKEIKKRIIERKIFPCCFGSALRLKGVETFLNVLEEYSCIKVYPLDFGAKVFKISRDEQGNRLTHMKLTGGELRTRDYIEALNEKVNQIRIYSGGRYVPINVVRRGEICAVTGLENTYVGQNLGIENSTTECVLEPVLLYRVILPEGVDNAVAVARLRTIEEEDPMLSIIWNEALQEIHVKIMGEIQLQIIKCMVKERFDMEIDFDRGNVLYMETIKNVVEGVGHFEPLRHYAEVHVKLEPLESGSGVQICSECSEDKLSKNWQKTILYYLKEKEHKGVLTGSPITDIRITLVNGRSHLKHTEGGDFMQAACRAVRQGLKMAESVLLEPYYDFRLEIPNNMVGKAMTDMERMKCSMNPPETLGDTSIITGSGPVVILREYNKDISAYTKGKGKMFCNYKGYYPCHNEANVLEKKGYDSESDLDNPTGSVFCSHGAGFFVKYDEVYKYMHLPNEAAGSDVVHETDDMDKKAEREDWLSEDEVEKILNKAYNANKKSDEYSSKNLWRKSKSVSNYGDDNKHSPKPRMRKEEYLIVDGYNVIYVWDELRELATVSFEAARGKLMDILCNYQAIKKCNIIVVFDAYRVKGHDTEVFDYNNIHVVFTKEAETADQYIEKFAHQNGAKYSIIVATSDRLEQIIIRGSNCLVLASKDLKEEIEDTVSEELERFYVNQDKVRNYLLEDAVLRWEDLTSKDGVQASASRRLQ